MPDVMMLSSLGGLLLLVMVLLLVSRSVRGRPRDLIIGGGSARITVPGSLRSHTDSDGNVLVYPAGSECITLRFSVMTAAYPDRGDNPMLGVVRDRAAEGGWEFEVRGRKGIASNRERAEERGSQLLMHFWEIGEGETLTTVSATILERTRDDPRVAEVLAIIPAVIASLLVTYERREIQTPTGLIQVTTTQVEPSPQEIRSFGSEQSSWLVDQLTLAKSLVDRFSGAEFDDPLDPRALDRAFTHWLLAKPASPTGDDMANALGAAFGQFCVRELKMEWVVVNDDYGTTYAIRHESSGGMAYPVNSVRKRVQSGATNFFEPIFKGIEETIAGAEDQD